jgi:hypothetical protein
MAPIYTCVMCGRSTCECPPRDVPDLTAKSDVQGFTISKQFQDIRFEPVSARIDTEQIRINVGSLAIDVDHCGRGTVKLDGREMKELRALTIKFNWAGGCIPVIEATMDLIPEARKSRSGGDEIPPESLIIQKGE